MYSSVWDLDKIFLCKFSISILLQVSAGAARFHFVMGMLCIFGVRISVLSLGILRVPGELRIVVLND